MISEIIYFQLNKQPENYNKASNAVICTSNLICSFILNVSVHGRRPGYFTKPWQLNYPTWTSGVLNEAHFGEFAFNREPHKKYINVDYIFFNCIIFN